MAVIDEHSIIDHHRGLERFELLVRIQRARTEFPPGQTARADQYGAINRRRRLSKFPRPHRIRSRQRLARNPVVAEINHSPAEMHEAAILHSPAIQAAFRGFQLLRPVHV
jgi:hypothetical protein